MAVVRRHLPCLIQRIMRVKISRCALKSVYSDLPEAELSCFLEVSASNKLQKTLDIMGSSSASSVRPNLYRRHH
jgi:hypothetical protein